MRPMEIIFLLLLGSRTALAQANDPRTEPVGSSEAIVEQPAAPVSTIAVPLPLVGQAVIRKVTGFGMPESGSAQATHLSSLQAGPVGCKRSRPRVVGQFLLGVVGAWVGGLVPFAIIDDISAPDRRVKGDAGYQPNANTAFALGSWVGSTLGVWVGGPQSCGSLVRTAIGTGVPSAALLLGRNEPYLPIVGFLFVAPLQALGGTVMFPKR